jgi:hypothetical protein
LESVRPKAICYKTGCGIGSRSRAGEVDQFGHRYVIDFPLEHAGRRALVRAAWIVLTNEDFPRLTSCYILRGL